MGRPAGSRSRDHDARREEILARIAARLAQPDAMHASYRDLAVAGGVSISTLQHYFGRRADIVAAVLRQAQHNAVPYLKEARQPQGDFSQSVNEFLANLRLGFEQFGLGELHALGLVEGLGNTVSGPVMVDAVLEPTIAALTARLADHQSAGEMRDDSDARHAALMLLSPMILLLLHQRELGGAAAYPADLDRFVGEHAAAFVRAHRRSDADPAL
jgi:AcrR family transcriptional regulator